MQILIIRNLLHLPCRQAGITQKNPERKMAENEISFLKLL
jgi:hypothetical protein